VSVNSYGVYAASGASVDIRNSTATDNGNLVASSEHLERIGVTLSFGTVERILDQLADVFQAHALVAHRLAILLRASLAVSGELNRAASLLGTRRSVVFRHSRHEPADGASKSRSCQARLAAVQ
jgi:hypothetical protein